MEPQELLNESRLYPNLCSYFDDVRISLGDDTLTPKFLSSVLRGVILSRAETAREFFEESVSKCPPVPPLTQHPKWEDFPADGIAETEHTFELAKRLRGVVLTPAESKLLDIGFYDGRQDTDDDDDDNYDGPISPLCIHS